MAEVPTVKALMRHKVVELRDMLKELGEDTKGKKVRRTQASHTRSGACLPWRHPPQCRIPVAWRHVRARCAGLKCNSVV